MEHVDCNEMFNLSTVFYRSRDPSTRIFFISFSYLFHIIFIETETFLCVFTLYLHENDQKRSLKTRTFGNDATTTTNYSTYLDTQTIDFRLFLPFSIVFIVFVWMGENDTKIMCICNTIVAFSLKTISFLMKTYSCRQGLND